MHGVCLLHTGPQIGSSGGRKHRGDWVSLLDSTWPGRDFRARAQESRQSAPATRVEVRTPSPHPGPPRAARCHPDQTRGGSAACSARGTSRLAHSPLAKNVIAPAGLSRNRPPRRECRRRARAGGGRSGSQTLAGADQCPGQGWKGRERARATPSRVWEEVRCREQAGERDSLPGPFLLLPSPGTGGSSPRPVPSGLRLRAWLLPQQPPSKSPQPKAKGQGWGPYLGIDFCVLRRCVAAQTAQKHQQQRQQSRSCRLLLVTK